MKLYIKKNFLLISLLSLIIIPLIIFTNGSFLVIYNHDGKILKSFPVSIGDKFNITFIHSSELEPWENLFVIKNREAFALTEMRVPTTGPGVPSVLEDGWELKIENGVFIYKVINREYHSLNFVVSPISPHYLNIKGQDINLVQLAGEWAPITIALKRGLIFH